jgi:hypothetical protein
VLEPGKQERQALTEMTEDDLDAGVPVEQAAEHQPDRMCGGLMREAPGRAHERGVPLVDAGLRWQRFTGMEVDRDVQFGDLRPQRSVERVVEITPGLVVADVGVAVDQRSDGAEVTHRTLQFSGRLAGVLGRKAGEHRQPGGELVHVGRADRVVRVARDPDSRLDVEDRLHARGSQRQDRPLDPGLVHQRDPLLDVKQMRLDVLRQRLAVTCRLPRRVP